MNVGYVVGISLAHREMRSALPDAPIVPEREGRPRVRRATVRALRRMADRMERVT